MSKYYYRLNDSTELGKKLKSLLYECDKANRAADTYCQKVGAKTFYDNPSMMAGGVVCVGFGDQQPDTKLWRSVGKDGDGLEMWEPNCQTREDCIILPRRDFRPSDTAARLYARRPSRFSEVVSLHTRDEWIQMAAINTTDDPQKDWRRAVAKLEQEGYWKYIELYYNDEQRQQSANDARYHQPLYMRRAIHLEYQRLKLPVVSIQTIYSLLQVDISDGNPNQKKVVQATTPVIFLHYGRYYIGCDHPCNHPSLEAIEEGRFNIKKIEFHRLLNSPELTN